MELETPAATLVEVEVPRQPPVSEAPREGSERTEAWAPTLAQLLRGEPLKMLRPPIESLPQPYQGYAAQLSLIEGREARREALQRIAAGLDDQWALVGPIMRALDASRPRITDEIPPAPLPASAQPDPNLAAGVGLWIDEYVRYATAVAPMTPRGFHISAALFLVGAAIARRLVLRMPWARVYPNLLVTWIAPTTLYGKTTALDIARGIAGSVFPYLLAPEDSTPEALISDMAGCEPANLDRMSESLKAHWEQARNFAAQRALIVDEFSGLISRSTRDFNAGLLESLMRAQNCDPRFVQSTRKHGQLEVRDAYLSLLGVTTPAALGTHLAPESPLWTTGWWPRFALLTPGPGRPEYKEAEVVDEPPGLRASLRNLLDRLPRAKYPERPEPISVLLGPGVLDAVKAYRKATGYTMITDDLPGPLHGVYGRMAVQAMKSAMILAALDWPEDHAAPTIEIGHLARAIEIAESWRASAHRVIAIGQGSDYARLSQRIRGQLERAGAQGVTFRDITRGMRDVKPPSRIHRTLEELVAAGEVESLSDGSGPKGGRPTDRFRLASG